MTARASRAELLHDALDLPVEERAQLAADLLATLDGPPDSDARGAWTEELRRRVERMLAGEATAVSWSELRAKLRERWAK
ncbi:MAG TPA: addiction module protein [Polyangiaceae bacterium]|nr:addiction module protein [Polyangiaceae bacterium]